MIIFALLRLFLSFLCGYVLNWAPVRGSFAFLGVQSTLCTFLRKVQNHKVDVVINEAQWSVPRGIQHDRLLQLINGVKLPAIVDSLLQSRPQMA